jgi:5-formyltetrahydrofolate cyclo-ligase
LKVRLQPHDFTVDYIVTPDEIIQCKGRRRRPQGIYWELLPAEKIAAIPALRKMKKHNT